MIECVSCGASSLAEYQFCPSCGEPFDAHAEPSTSDDAENLWSDGEQAPTVQIQPDAPPALPPAPIARLILLHINALLLGGCLGLFIANVIAPPVRAVGIHAIPTATPTDAPLATDMPSSSVPVVSASPAPTHAGVSAPPTTVPAPKPTATATAIPTATATPNLLPPTPRPPTPTPTATPK